jgi:NIPSNAP
MTLEYQLRDYLVKPGEMNEWVEEWREKVLPIRKKFGFKVAGAWQIGEERFVWILGYEGKEGFKRADERYYSSPDRKELTPDPARHLTATDHHMMTDVLEPSNP